MPLIDPVPLDITDLGAAARDAWIDAVVALVNDRYEATEAVMWAPGVTRAHRDQVRGLVEDGTLLHVCTETDPPGPDTLVGVVNVILPDPHSAPASPADAPTAEFGMLAVHPRAAGRGLGSRLVRAAEKFARQHGCTVMELDVLRPAEGTAEAKELLGAWYPRLGYQLVSTTPIEQVRPDMVASLSMPCVLDRYRRSLHVHPQPDQEPH